MKTTNIHPMHEHFFGDSINLQKSSQPMHEHFICKLLTPTPPRGDKNNKHTLINLMHEQII